MEEPGKYLLNWSKNNLTGETADPNVLSTAVSRGGKFLPRLVLIRNAPAEKSPSIDDLQALHLV